MIVIAVFGLRSHLWETEIKRMISDALIFYLLKTKYSGSTACLPSIFAPEQRLIRSDYEATVNCFELKLMTQNKLIKLKHPSARDTLEKREKLEVIKSSARQVGLRKRSELFSFLIVFSKFHWKLKYDVGFLILFWSSRNFLVRIVCFCWSNLAFFLKNLERYEVKRLLIGSFWFQRIENIK